MTAMSTPTHRGLIRALDAVKASEGWTGPPAVRRDGRSAHQPRPVARRPLGHRRAQPVEGARPVVPLRTEDRSVKWQPIATAPKDTDILGWDGHDMRVTVWMTRPGGAGWFEQTDRYEIYFWDPTHWMPLPEPPGAADADD